MGAPPFNALAIFLVPYYMCVSDERKLRYVNNIFTIVQFVPVALVLTLVFMAGNLVLLPFAYLGAIFKKIKLLRKGRSKKKQAKSGTSCSDLGMFFLFGVPMLLLS